MTETASDASFGCAISACSFAIAARACSLFTRPTTQTLGRDALDQTGDPAAWARLLEEALVERLRDAPAALDPCAKLLEEMRGLGHDLWSFDEDGVSYASWTSDHVNPKPGRRLAVSIHVPPYEEPTVRVSVADEP